jgi:hypothetical protein
MSTSTYNFVVPKPIMKILIILLCSGILISGNAFAQSAKKTTTATKTNATITIDGLLNEAAWKTTPVTTNFTALRPAPFVPESFDNRTEIFFLYNSQGIYIGGYLHEKTKDSIASELIGRDGFGNNDFLGIVFDTYQDKLNGFEYFVTPLGEQMDAKIAPNNNGNNEDFAWNAVWKSASKIHNDGWSFEIFLPYAAIRFGNKKIQDWGLNIVRRRQKSGGQLFWQSIDPTANGFLTQAGTLTGLQNLKPPVRLQLSPYFSVYQDKAAGTNKFTTAINGGADIKYGINQAFTLDMTLVPDFGQVVTDNKVLNLSPFEVQFNENRTFFTEGTELFNKGNLFYSRRIGNIGGVPRGYYDVQNALQPNEVISANPTSIKLLNATKVSGRTQKGLGVGILNAVTKAQQATVYNNVTNQSRNIETEPLTNYNVLVLDQTLKNNSSVSFVNTNVIRSGSAPDANVGALLFEFNNKKNSWNVGGNVGYSKIAEANKKTPIGYTHNLYVNKTSGRFNMNIWQDVVNADYDKSDLGYFTNNNQMINGIWMGYNWIKPTKVYNSARLNGFMAIGNLISDIDPQQRKALKYMGADFGINGNLQLKNLWSIGANFNASPNGNDFYEPRVYGKFFKTKAKYRFNTWWSSNDAKKLSWGGELSFGKGDVFNQTRGTIGFYSKVRFNAKFSIDQDVSYQFTNNQAGFAAVLGTNDVYFSRRNIGSTENVLNFKYSFTNRMGLTWRIRHYYSKVKPLEFYLLNNDGLLVAPTTPFTGNVNQNYNFISGDFVYTWQFAQGSFLNVVWKNIGDNFERSFEKNYISNLNKTINSDQATSFSLRIIYFLDYLTVKNRFSKQKPVL